MSAPFDPYHKWLAIRPNERPITHYRLLGLSALEDDTDVIADAVERQRGHVKNYQNGQYAAEAAKVLEHLSQAEICLLNPAKKSAYDAELRKTLNLPPPPPSRAPVAVPMTTPAALPIATPAAIPMTTPAVAPQAEPAALAQPVELVSINTDVPDATRGVSLLVGVALGMLVAIGGIAGYFLYPRSDAVAINTDTPETPSVPPPASVPPTTPGVGPAATDPVLNTDPPPVDPAPPATVTPTPPITTPAVTPTTPTLPSTPVPVPTTPVTTDPPVTPQPPVTTPIPPPVTPPTTTPEPTPEDLPAEPAVFKLLAVPEGAALTAARKQLRETLGDQFDAKTDDEKQALAQTLLKAAFEVRSDNVLVYANLDEAITAATAAGDAELAWQAINALDQLFDIKPIPLKSAALREASRHETTEPEQVAAMYQALIDQAVERDEFDAAGVLVSAGVVAARKAESSDLVTALQNRTKELRDWRAEFLKAKAGRDKLSSGDDPEASLVVGRYTCLVQNRWSEGAPLLAKSADPAYQKLAEMELGDLTKVQDRIALGDAWWAAHEADSTVYKPLLQRRALQWYDRSLNEAPPAEFNRLGQRIADLPKTVRPVSFGKVEVPGELIASLTPKAAPKPPQTASLPKRPPLTTPTTPTPPVVAPPTVVPPQPPPRSFLPQPPLSTNDLARLPAGAEKARAFVDSQIGKLDDMFTRQADLFQQWKTRRSDYKKLEEKLIPIQKDAQLVDQQARVLQTQLAQLQGAVAVQQARLSSVNDIDRANARTQLQNLDAQIRPVRLQLSTLQSRFSSLTAQAQDIQRQGATVMQEATRLANDSDNVTRDWLMFCDPLGRYGEEFRNQAIKRYSDWIRQEPELALPYIARALAYVHRGDSKVAETDLDQALTVDPRMKPLVQGMKAWLGARAEGLSKHLSSLNQAIRTAPKLHVLYLLRGQLQFEEGDYSKALDDFAKVARESPQTAEAFEWQGLIYGAAPRDDLRSGTKAIEAAAQACELTGWGEWRSIDTLALAYAEKGDFAGAVKNAESALKLAPAEQQAMVREHLEKFKTNTTVQLGSRKT